MKRLKIFKAYFVLWLFVYFIAITNIETFKLYFMSTLTFNIAIVAILSIGTFMLLKAAKDLTMVAGTFGVIMYKKGDISFYLQGIEKIFPSTIAQKIASRAKKRMLYFTRQEADDILAWLEETYANQNKYNNFFTGTVLMIGLLGTFAGLLGSIASMGGIVSSLAGSDVDIGKIMAGFATPLSSMAVGFGSSLFGVISAVLLSIMGYLLNKSQASLLGGVENWLQSRIIEESYEAKSEESQTAIVQANRSTLDLFLEQIGTLSSQIAHFSEQNSRTQQQIEHLSAKIAHDTKSNQTIFEQVSQSFEVLAKSHQEQTKTNQAITGILRKMQSDQQKSAEELQRRDYIITNMMRKFEDREDAIKVGLFNIVEAIESMNSHLKQKDETIQKILHESIAQRKSTTHSHTKIDEIGAFMKRHFQHQEEKQDG